MSALETRCAGCGATCLEPRSLLSRNFFMASSSHVLPLLNRGKRPVFQNNSAFTFASQRHSVTRCFTPLPPAGRTRKVTSSREEEDAQMCPCAKATESACRTHFVGDCERCFTPLPSAGRTRKKVTSIREEEEGAQMCRCAKATE